MDVSALAQFLSDRIKVDGKTGTFSFLRGAGSSHCGWERAAVNDDFHVFGRGMSRFDREGCVVAVDWNSGAAVPTRWLVCAPFPVSRGFSGSKRSTDCICSCMFL